MWRQRAGACIGLSAAVLLLGSGCSRSSASGDDAGAKGPVDGGAYDAGQQPAAPLPSVPFFGAAGNAPANLSTCDTTGPMPSAEAQRCSAVLNTDAVVIGQVDHMDISSGPIVWDEATQQAEMADKCTGVILPVLDIGLKVRYRLRGTAPGHIQAEVLFGSTWTPHPVASDGGVGWDPTPPYPNGAGAIAVGQSLGAYIVQDSTDGVWGAAVFNLASRAGTNEAACCFQALPCWADAYPPDCRMLAVDLSQEVTDCENGKIQPAWPPRTLTTARRRAAALPHCHH